MSRGARYFNVEAWCYSGEYLTNGRITSAALADIAPGVSLGQAMGYARELVRAGLWSRTRDAYEIHDYLHYNLSAEEARAEESQRVSAGRAGGTRSVAVRRQKYGSARPQSKAPTEATASRSDRSDPFDVSRSDPRSTPARSAREAPPPKPVSVPSEEERTPVPTQGGNHTVAPSPPGEPDDRSRSGGDWGDDADPEVQLGKRVMSRLQTGRGRTNEPTRISL